MRSKRGRRRGRAGRGGTARPDSDIDLLVHFVGGQSQLHQLECWFQGWSLALAEMNYSRTGVRMPEMLDVTYLSDAEVASGAGLAGLIGAVTLTGSLIAFGKLAEILPGGQVGFPGMKAFNAIVMSVNYCYP